jgi:signal transduction histidine kinase
MLTDSSALTAILLIDHLLEQAWAAGASESWFAAPVVVVVACAAALSKNVGRESVEASASTARLLRTLEPERGVDAVLRSALRELRGLAAAREIVVALDNPSSPPLLMVDTVAIGDGAARVRELAGDEYPNYFFPLGSDGDVRVVAVDTLRGFAPAAFRRAHACGSLIAVRFCCGETRDGRVFLLDPAPHPDRDRFLQSFERLLSQLMPALARVSDLHAMRHRAAALERARIGRELHDGVVQGLANIDMELELIRSAARTVPPDVLERLQRVQEHLRSEMREVRTLVQRERYHDIEASRLPAVIEDIVERFRRDAGIDADHVFHISEVRLSPQVCGEIARIVQEALVNVRRHSGARHVRVTFACDSAQWTLSIEDDGRGFAGGSGTGNPATARAVHPPSVIHERARSIGGTVRVVTPRGRGARLEITGQARHAWNRTA